MKRKKQGFTLIELIVTIALLAIAGTVIAVNMVSLNKQQQAKEKTRIESAIKAAAEAYVSKENIAISQESCISVEYLIEQGYIKESEVSDYKDQAVSVTISSDGKIYNISEDSNCRQTNNLKIYTLKYNANGGSNAPSSTQTNGQSFDVTISSKTPTRNGYVFIGWSKSKSATSASFSPGSTITLSENTTLYAVWTVDKYTLAYDKNTTDEVTNLPLIQTAGYAEDINISEIIPQRIGYSFISWNTKADLNGENYNPESIYTITENSTLYANWQINTYTVNYDMDGGSPQIESQSGEYKSQIKLNNTMPSKECYTFVEYEGSDGKVYSPGQNYSIPANDLTLKATYQIIPVTITYDTKGGGTLRNQNLDCGSTTRVSGTEKFGYTLLGYSTDNSNVVSYKPGDYITPKEDTTLYAVWQANSYTVTFNANGGNVSQESKSVTYDSTYGTLPTPTRSGYTFEGWYTSASGGSKVTSSTKVTKTSNHTLYAHWKANTYKVTFNANGGSVSQTSKSVTYNSTYGTLPTPTRSGYEFIGWYTTVSGGNKITNTSKVTTASNHYLYARWKKIEYTVVLKLDVKNQETDYPTIYHNNNQINVTSDSVVMPKIALQDNYKFEVSAAGATSFSNISCTNAKVNTNLSIESEEGEESYDVFTLSNPTNDIVCTLSYYKNDQILVNSVRDEEDYTSFYTDEWKKKNQTVLDFEMVSLDVGKYESSVLLSFIRPYKKNGYYDYYFTDTYGSAYWTGYYIHGIRNGVLEYYSSTRWKPCSSRCYSHSLVQYDLAYSTKEYWDTDGPVDNYTDDYGWDFPYFIDPSPDYSNARGETSVPNDVKEQLSNENIDEYLKLFDSTYAGNRRPSRTNLCIATESGLYEDTSTDGDMKCYTDDIYYFKDAKSGQYGVLVTYKHLEGIKAYYKIARIVLRNPNQEVDEDESISEQQKRYYIYNDSENYSQNKYKYNLSTNQGTGKYYKMFYILDITTKNGILYTNSKYYSNGDTLTSGNSSSNFAPSADYNFFVKGSITMSPSSGTSKYWWVYKNHADNGVIWAYGSNGYYIKSPTQLINALQQTQFRKYNSSGSFKVNVDLFE